MKEFGWIWRCKARRVRVGEPGCETTRTYEEAIVVSRCCPLLLLLPSLHLYYSFISSPSQSFFPSCSQISASLSSLLILCFINLITSSCLLCLLAAVSRPSLVTLHIQRLVIFIHDCSPARARVCQSQRKQARPSFTHSLFFGFILCLFLHRPFRKGSLHPFVLFVQHTIETSPVSDDSNRSWFESPSL
jgi:hypothetical protein